MNVHLVYMTFGSKTEARETGRALVTEGLAACVNILDGMNALYMWDGQLQDDAEVAMIAKTIEDRIPELVERVQALHGAECPCVVSLPVSGGHEPFLDWVAGQVAGSR